MNNPENEAEFDPFQNEGKKNKPNRSSGGVAWLALLLAFAGIAFSAWQWWQEQSTDTRDQEQEMALADLSSAQSGFQQSLDALQGRLSSAEQRDDSGAFDAIRSDLRSIQSRLSELGMASSDDHTVIEAVQASMLDLDQRIADLETSVAALAVRSDSPGRRMDLAEVDYLLRMAGERLALFGDTGSAEQALALADSQLEQLDDPLYLPVRRRIVESRQELQAVPSPDRVQISGQIASLQRVISTLPFPGETPVDVIVQDQENPGLWQRIKNALAPLVKVRRRVDEDLVLSLEDKDYLRQGVWLQLESARLALMRNDQLAWSQSLSSAKERVSSRFDTTSRAVRDAVSGIEGLLETELVQQLPDISAPWRQLRLLREGSAEPQAPDTATPGPMNNELPVTETPELEQAPAQVGVEGQESAGQLEDDGAANG